MPTLHCSSADPLRFQKPAQRIFLPDRTVHVWKFPVTGMDRSLLSENEIVYTERFRSDADKNRFSTGRQMLRLLSSKYLSVPPEKIIVSGERHQKPVIGNSTKSPFHFNLSHSGEWVLIAFADSELGVDLEEINRPFSFGDIVHDQFREPEQNFVFNAPDPANAFYVLWTRKEALLKAWGLGLKIDLRAIPSMDGSHTLSAENNSWKLNSFYIEDHYQAAIAFSDQIQSVSYLDGSGLMA